MTLNRIIFFTTITGFKTKSIVLKRKTFDGEELDLLKVLFALKLVIDIWELTVLYHVLEKYERTPEFLR